MTDRRYSGGCESNGSSSSGGGGNSSNYSGGSTGSSSKPVAAAARCHHKYRAQAIVRRCSGNGGSPLQRPLVSVMRVKKTWKNVAVMLLAVAAVSTATAAFYFNYAATACCVVRAQSPSRSSSSYALSAAEPSDPLAAAAAAADDDDDQSDRAKVGSSVLRASKLYAVCKTHDYRRRAVDRHRLRRGRRQSTADETTPDGSPPENGGDGTAGGETADAQGAAAGPENATLIYFVTPTYPRREQIAELTRLGQTLMHVPQLHWIVADDRPDCSAPVTELLRDFSIPYTYIASPMPAIYKRAADAMPRGVSNRRAALNWIRLNHDANDANAVIYFGDDDNTFHLDLFKEIRTTKKISMFPVGLVGEYGVSSPIIDKGKVVGFFDSWPAKRKFPVDMAGFAINVRLLFQYPYATMPYKAGFEEDRFLSALAIRLDEIEPKAENCTRILVWHTQTAKKPKPTVKVKSKATLPGSLATLLDRVTMLGVGDVSETTGVRSYMTKNGNIFRV